MGFNRTLKKLFCIFIFLLFLVISNFAFPSSSSSHEIQSKTAPKEPAQYQLFYIKNAPPFILDSEGVYKKKRKNGKMVRKRKKQIKNLKTRPASFSVMLPKGFVPPSGSSPCHNEKPNNERVAFYCDLSTSKP
ncbi:hypothetical protein MANES_15G120700v8 [Manihot esculenta]|uniref:Uncharacterized protein n=1 Tax=Manihot esculenta TaxID=3983 RepID=A0A2C9UGB8_MANES|nr:hypothetical protein MANES_15G120700v8 [Manihot esculenta]